MGGEGRRGGKGGTEQGWENKEEKVTMTMEGKGKFGKSNKEEEM